MACVLCKSLALALFSSSRSLSLSNRLAPGALSFQRLVVVLRETRVSFEGEIRERELQFEIRDSRVFRDFEVGFGRHLEATALAETLCGSPLYMAPEILSFKRYDAKADLWSVGAVLFEMAFD